MADDREPLGRIAHAVYRDWLTEQVQRMYGDAAQEGSWEDLTEAMREAYMRIGSAVAAQAVKDAGLECERMKAQLFAIGAHMPAVRRALVIAITESAYEAEAKPYREALKVYGAGEDQERGEDEAHHG